MIQANELRYNNLFDLYGEVVQIVGFNTDNVRGDMGFSIKLKRVLGGGEFVDSKWSGNIKPIVLTVEILERMGYKRTNENGTTFFKPDSLIMLRLCSGSFSLDYFGTVVRHVHHLQNLVFELFGEDPELLKMNL